MSNETSREYTIYLNIIKYIENLGYTLSSKPKTYSEFNVIMQVVYYVDLKATNKDKKIHVFQLSGDDSIKMSETMYSKVSANTPVTVVGNQLINMTKNVIEYSTKKINITYLNTKLFITDIRNHVMVPKHEICTEGEKDIIMRDNFITEISQFPKIKFNDPQVILLDGKPGQLVRIIRRDPATGNSIYYRIIV
jgi:DNA-directed RNA polymerase subunit H (RpoH/RPB5)